MKKLLLSCIALCLTTIAIAQKPFVIPELREWKAAKGQFTVDNKTRVVVKSDNKNELTAVAEAFAADVKEMFNITLAVEIGAAKGDNIIFFELAKIPTTNTEGYKIASSNSRLTVAANAKVGAYWATRTLLQIMEQSTTRTIPAGVAVDYPQYAMRGLMLDVGRKYFPLEFLQQYVKFMSYYKMNTFQVHLNDNGFKQFFNHDWAQTQAAFRLESTTYPGLTAKDGHYTKEEFRQLQILGENNFVNIIPEIDAPAHTLAFSRYMPEIGSEKYGADHLDLFKPETYKFMDGLFKEYLEGADPVFRGKYVHIGTDEYSNKDQVVVEQFRKFTDHYIRYVESYGKRAAVWGALTHARGTTPVKVDSVLMWCWYNGYGEPDSMMQLGYDVVSIPDGSVYIVPMAGYYYDYLNTKRLYEKWTPASIGNKTFDANHPQIKGGLFAVWNDHPGNGISTRDVHHRVWPAMQTLAVKMWDGANATLSYDEFNAKRELLSEAPGVNILGRAPKGVVMEIKTVSSEQKTDLNEIGYDYRVDFNVFCPAALSKASVLSYCPEAIFYLADPLQGKLGFSRDGYLFTFDYTLPVGRSVAIGIQGTSRLTKLYVDGKLVETLDVTYISVDPKNGSNTRRALIKTLQFPLAEFGYLKARVTDFVVTKL